MVRRRDNAPQRPVPSPRAWAWVLLLTVWAGWGGVTTAATWGLFLDIGVPEGATFSLPSIRDDLAALKADLHDTFGVPVDRVRLVVDGGLTREGVKQALDAFGKRVRDDDLVFLYIRAFATKPRTKASKYFFPRNHPVDRPVEEPPAAIRDTELAAWVDAAFPRQKVVLLFDLYTSDPELGVYFGARQEIGTAALMLISRRPLPRSMPAYLVDAFSEAADEDNDRILEMEELARTVQNAVYKDVTSDETLVAGTGLPDLRLAVFPSAIIVETQPRGATVTIDGVEAGQSPLRYAPLERKRYEVRVAREGYHRPEPQTVEVTELKGRGYVARFPLEAIRIRGEVVAPKDVEIGEVLLGIAPKGGLATRLAGPGPFDFSSEAVPLEVGKEYRLLAGTADDRFFGDATFRFGGYEDIVLSVPLEKRTLWEIAVKRFEAGYQGEALAAATQALDASYEIPHDLPTELMLYLLEQWSAETRRSRFMIGCAVLATYLGDLKTAREYWKLAKAAAPKGSKDYKYASRALRRWSSRGLLILLAVVLLAGVTSFLVFVVQRRRDSGRKT